MKKFKFKDGIEVTADTINEAKEEHRKIFLDYEVTSMATIVKTPTMSICVNDNENYIGDPYLTVYSGIKYQSAEKMCKIYFEKAEYVKKYRNTNKANNWILNSQEKKELINLLNKDSGSSSFTKKELSNWEYAIIKLNFEKGTNQEQTEKLIMENPKYIQDKDLLPFNLPMPDYTKL